MQNKRIRLRRKNALKKIVLTLSIIIFLFVVLIWALHDSRIRIKNIFVKGNSAITETEIKNVVSSELSGKYLRLLPKDSILFYPRNTIGHKIKDTFKRISDTDIVIDNMSSISVSINERKPYALWCTEDVSEEKSIILNSCYFIDNKGFAFVKAPTFSDYIYLTVFQKQIGENDGKNILGKSFLDEKRFTHLMNLRELLEKEGLRINRLAEIGEGDFEFYITDGGKLIFSETQDSTKLVSNLISAIEAKVKEKNDVRGRSAVLDKTDILGKTEYIDMRFDDKVLFKFI